MDPPRYNPPDSVNLAKGGPDVEVHVVVNKINKKAKVRGSFLRFQSRNHQASVSHGLFGILSHELNKSGGRGDGRGLRWLAGRLKWLAGRLKWLRNADP